MVQVDMILWILQIKDHLNQSVYVNPSREEDLFLGCCIELWVEWMYLRPVVCNKTKGCQGRRDRIIFNEWTFTPVGDRVTLIMWYTLYWSHTVEAVNWRPSNGSVGCFGVFPPVSFVLRFSKSQNILNIHNRITCMHICIWSVTVSFFSLITENLHLIHGLLLVRRPGGVWDSGAAPLPLAPLAPVLRCEMKAFWIDAQVSLLHRSFMTVHNVLWESQDVLTLESRMKTEVKHHAANNNVHHQFRRRREKANVTDCLSVC